MVPVCQKWLAEVKDVLGVHMLDKTWKTTQDHSKWAVSKTHFCVGDKNRQQAQCAGELWDSSSQLHLIGRLML